MPATPTRIKLRGPGGITVTWSDGHVSVYPYADLRKKCPCARCEDRPPQVLEMTEGALPIFGQEPIRPIRAVPIGNYAVQIQWNDGHDSGLYSFSYLRELCPCPECQEVV